MERSELRSWVEDALSRHDRDVRERAESVENVTVSEIVDAVWGRLPLEIRRGTTRGQVQASLTMITLRQGIAAQRAGAEESAADPAAIDPAAIDPGAPSDPVDPPAVTDTRRS